MKYTRAQNMLLGIAIGDAFGAGYEFAGTRDEIARDISFTAYKSHPKHHITPGMYTDDTQMSIAIAGHLLSYKPFTKRALAEAFVSTYKRDPIDGYSRGFQSLLEQVADGKELLAHLKADSTRNGAAMRAVPVGILKGKGRVATYARINAEATHNTPAGLASSVGVALLSHFTYHELNSQTLLQYIEPELRTIHPETADHLTRIDHMDTFDAQLLFGQEEGIPCDGMRTLGAVYYLLKNNPDPLDALREAILLGGDTDSVAAITLGIAGMKGLDTLPDFLLKDLTNHAYGREYLLALGRELSERFPERA